MPGTSTRALIRFTALWVIAGAVVATGLILVLDAADGPPPLPPLREADLGAAVREAGCTLTAPLAGNLTSAQEADLRRGVVLIRHRPDLAEDSIEQLELVRRRVPAATKVTAGGTTAAVAATAWRRELSCGRFDSSTLDALRLFRARYIGRGPDAPAP